MPTNKTFILLRVYDVQGCVHGAGLSCRLSREAGVDISQLSIRTYVKRVTEIIALVVAFICLKFLNSVFRS